MKLRLFNHFGYILAAVMALLCAIAPGVAEAAHVDEVGSPRSAATIGVLAPQGTEKAVEMWQPLIDYLDGTLPQYQFAIAPLTLDNINERIAAKALDFVLTSAASYIELEHEFGARRIATVQWHRDEHTYAEVAAVIFTRKDNPNIYALEDLRGSHLVAVHPNAFGGWWMAEWEMRRAGVHADDLRKLTFTGFPHEDVVQSVREGLAEAGTVRAGVLESMAAKGLINLDDFRVIGSQPRDHFPLLHSTRLYPERAIAVLSHTHSELARQVSIALLSAPKIPVNAVGGQSISWTLPLDYSTVHGLMRDLAIGPYRNELDGGWHNLFPSTSPWLLALVLAATVTGALLLFIRHLLRRLVEAQATAARESARLINLQQLTRWEPIVWDEHVSHVLQVGCKLLGADFAIATRVQFANKSWHIVRCEGNPSLAKVCGQQYALPSTLTGMIHGADKPVALASLSPQLWQRVPDSPVKDVVALLATTFRANGQAVGTLEFYWKRSPAAAFRASDEALLQIMAYCVSLADARRSTRAAAAAADAATAPGSLRLEEGKSGRSETPARPNTNPTR